MLLKLFFIKSVKYYFRILKISGLFAVFLCGFLPNLANGQQETNVVKLLKGEVLTADSLNPIPNAHLISKNNRWGTISNEDGKFKLYVSLNDSVLITSIGYRPIILFIDDTSSQQLADYPVLMKNDTVLINEIIIRGYWDYRTFKQIIINMEPLDLGNFYDITEGIDKELEFNPAYKGIKGPIQALYDRFNKNERLERKLIRNRYEYNQMMIKMGRIKDTIPAIPEHMRQ